MSANADFSTLLKCLASGKKSIEQLRPTTPRQTSALELLVVYCFSILLVYPCALYYGMLILSRVHGACPTPLPGSHPGQLTFAYNPPHPPETLLQYLALVRGMTSSATSTALSRSVTSETIKGDFAQTSPRSGLAQSLIRV